MNINSHEEHNLRFQQRWMDSSIQMASPFATDNQQPQQETAHSLYEQIIHSEHFNPFEILGVSADCSDLRKVKKNYKKKLLKYHPDKNKGNTLKYDVITHAYSLIEKHIKNTFPSETKRGFELRQESASFIEIQPKKKNINMGDDFNVETFNSLYEQYRMPDKQRDRGYGEWLQQKKTTDAPKVVNMSNFDKKFEKRKRKITSRKKNSIIIHKDPEANTIETSLRFSDIDPTNKSKYTTTATKHCTDIKDAYSEDKAVIDVGMDHNSIIQKRQRSINALKQKRANIQHSLSEEDAIKIQLANERKLKKEKKRLRRIREQDQRIHEHYNKIHKLMITKEK